MIKNITPPRVDTQSEREQIAQIKRYLTTLARDLTVILADVDRRLSEAEEIARSDESATDA